MSLTLLARQLCLFAGLGISAGTQVLGTAACPRVLQGTQLPTTSTAAIPGIHPYFQQPQSMPPHLSTPEHAMPAFPNASTMNWGAGMGGTLPEAGKKGTSGD